MPVRNLFVFISSLLCIDVDCRQEFYGALSLLLRLLSIVRNFLCVFFFSQYELKKNDVRSIDARIANETFSFRLFAYNYERKERLSSILPTHIIDEQWITLFLYFVWISKPLFQKPRAPFAVWNTTKPSSCANRTNISTWIRTNDSVVGLIDTLFYKQTRKHTGTFQVEMNK